MLVKGTEKWKAQKGGYTMGSGLMTRWKEWELSAENYFTMGCSAKIHFMVLEL